MKEERTGLAYQERRKGGKEERIKGGKEERMLAPAFFPPFLP